MSERTTLFQTALRKVAAIHTMQGLAKKSRLNRGTLTTYATGRSRPALDALEALARTLPPTERGPLILAHLLDECPAAARRDLILELRPHVQSISDEVAAGADQNLDALFSALRFLAETRPEVLEWLQSSLPLIQ